MSAPFVLARPQHRLESGMNEGVRDCCIGQRLTPGIRPMTTLFSTKHLQLLTQYIERHLYKDLNVIVQVSCQNLGYDLACVCLLRVHLVTCACLCSASSRNRSTTSWTCKCSSRFRRPFGHVGNEGVQWFRCWVGVCSGSRAGVARASGCDCRWCGQHTG